MLGKEAESQEEMGTEAERDRCARACPRIPSRINVTCNVPKKPHRRSLAFLCGSRGALGTEHRRPEGIF